MNYFDFHTDTLSSAYERGLTPFADSLQASLRCFSRYERAAVNYALWCDKRLDDDGAYRRFIDYSDWFENQIRGNLPENISYFLSIEDARLFCRHEDRFFEALRRGVRLLTLQWQGQTCIGGGWGTDVGLTPFGRRIVSLCFANHVAVDLSHASDRVFWEVAAMAEEANAPIYATHSDSRAVCPHPRNLTDEQFRAVERCGGLVGISLCPAHLCTASVCTAEDVFRHIDHYCSLGGSRHICIGSDFDGIDETPAGLHHPGDMTALCPMMQNHGYSKQNIDDIMWQNGFRHFRNIF